MDLISALTLGLVQGLTEFLPVSSTGHLVIAGDLFHINTNSGLAIDAVLHLATALAVIIYFRKDFTNLFKSLFKREDKVDHNQIWALVLGTIPAMILGLWLMNSIETSFRGLHVIAYALIAGSVVFVIAELLRKFYGDRIRANIIPRHGLWIGLFQSLALIPGMSRSGMVISGGMMLGYSREYSARFGFMLSLPIILGAGTLKLYELINTGVFAADFWQILVAATVAFISALFAIHVLIEFVKRFPLYWFVAYRVALALLLLYLF